MIAVIDFVQALVRLPENEHMAIQTAQGEVDASLAVERYVPEIGHVQAMSLENSLVRIWKNGAKNLGKEWKSGPNNLKKMRIISLRK